MNSRRNFLKTMLRLGVGAAVLPSALTYARKWAVTKDTWFHVTHTWVGNPEVFWDKDLYDGPPTRMSIDTVKDPATGLYLNVSSIWTLTGKKTERIEIAHGITSNEILTIKALRAGGVDI